jgi:hypothetical protein
MMSPARAYGCGREARGKNSCEVKSPAIAPGFFMRVASPAPALAPRAPGR